MSCAMSLKSKSEPACIARFYNCISIIWKAENCNITPELHNVICLTDCFIFAPCYCIDLGPVYTINVFIDETE